MYTEYELEEFEKKHEGLFEKKETNFLLSFSYHSNTFLASA